MVLLASLGLRTASGFAFSAGAFWPPWVPGLVLGGSCIVRSDLKRKCDPMKLNSQGKNRDPRTKTRTETRTDQYRSDPREADLVHAGIDGAGIVMTGACGSSAIVGAGLGCKGVACRNIGSAGVTNAGVGGAGSGCVGVFSHRFRIVFAYHSHRDAMFWRQ